MQMQKKKKVAAHKSQNAAFYFAVRAFIGNFAAQTLRS